MKSEPKCPAATIEKNVRGDEIARCGIEGIVILAAESPCCDGYVRCQIWKNDKELEWERGRHRTRRAERNQRTDGSLEWQ